jgi:hypothetical protein
MSDCDYVIDQIEEATAPVRSDDVTGWETVVFELEDE